MAQGASRGAKGAQGSIMWTWTACSGGF